VRPLALLPVGFTEPPQSPAALVRSYRTFSPLPGPVAVAGRIRPRRSSRRFVFCGTVPRVAPGCR